MIAYATATGTKTTIAAMKKHEWRFLLNPRYPYTKGMPYAMDNGAWGAFTRGEEWPEHEFTRVLEKHGAGSDWIVAPDIVEGGLESLEFSRSWIPRLLTHSRVLVAVQDGMELAHIDDLLSPDVGVFVGGSTEFKLGTMRKWCRAARRHGAWSHVGRVNSVRRINLCLAAGADSFDGTCVTQFPVHIGRLDAARRQRTMFEQWGDDETSND